MQYEHLFNAGAINLHLLIHSSGLVFGYYRSPGSFSQTYHYFIFSSQVDGQPLRVYNGIYRMVSTHKRWPVYRNESGRWCYRYEAYEHMSRGSNKKLVCYRWLLDCNHSPDVPSGASYIASFGLPIGTQTWKVLTEGSWVEGTLTLTPITALQHAKMQREAWRRRFCYAAFVLLLVLLACYGYGVLNIDDYCANGGTCSASIGWIWCASCSCSDANGGFVAPRCETQCIGGDVTGFAPDRSSCLCRLPGGCLPSWDPVCENFPCHARSIICDVSWQKSHPRQPVDMWGCICKSADEWDTRGINAAERDGSLCMCARECSPSERDKKRYNHLTPGISHLMPGVRTDKLWVV